MAQGNHDGSPGQGRNVPAGARELEGEPLAIEGQPGGVDDALHSDFAEMQALMAALPGMLGGHGSGPACGPAGTNVATLGARLGLLEESFGRICNVVGRLEQEVEALKERVAGHGR